MFRPSSVVHSRRTTRTSPFSLPRGCFYALGSPFCKHLPLLPPPPKVWRRWCFHPFLSVCFLANFFFSNFTARDFQQVRIETPWSLSVDSSVRRRSKNFEAHKSWALLLNELHFQILNTRPLKHCQIYVASIKIIWFNLKGKHQAKTLQILKSFRKFWCLFFQVYSSLGNTDAAMCRWFFKMLEIMESWDANAWENQSGVKATKCSPVYTFIVFKRLV